MIKEINIQHFKSIDKAKLSLGNLNIFIGTNASGKSNLFEAFKFLQGIGYGFSVDEILNGKSKTNSSTEWEGVRGGSKNVLFRTQKKTVTVAGSAFRIDILADIETGSSAYSILVDPSKNRVLFEYLLEADFYIFNTKRKKQTKGFTHEVEIFTGKKGRNPIVHLNDEHSALNQSIYMSPMLLDRKREAVILNFIKFLSDQQRLDVVPSVLREYSKQLSATRIGEKGENFASVVNAIITSDSKTKKEYLSWLQKLTPNEIEDVIIGKGAVNENIFGIKENGKTIYAPSLSDGTLRFAAITAAMFQPSAPKMLFIEEIENGIHPTRLRLLMELLMHRASKGDMQIFISTHSPVLLDWIKEKYYLHVFFCLRNANGSSSIKAINEIENFSEAIKKTSVSELFTEGWLETAV